LLSFYARPRHRSYSNGVFGGLNRLLVAAVVAAAVLLAPTAASASGCSGGPSAVNVYKECTPSGSGGKSSGGGGGGSKPSGGQAGSSSTTAPISSQARKALRHAGKDRRYLAHLIEGNHPANLINSGSSGAATAPSAVGSAFDLASGPTALLIALAGAAVLILGGSGVRVWRHRHRL
jgi:hypothetical protein